MLFSKPDMKYTEMCMYVDSIVAKEKATEQELNKCFEYIYHIAFMLAHKHKYFNRSYYYEEFAIFFATNVMYRLFFNPRLKKLDENGEPELVKIKSVLNYMKAVIYVRKVEFEQEYYSQKYISDVDSYNYTYANSDDLYKYNRELDINTYFKSLSKTVKNVVYKNNFYKKDKILMKNIYISCLLTVLNGLTFTQVDLDKIKNTYSSVDSKYKLIGRLYSNNKKESLILYHLDNSFSDYIKILSNKVNKQIKDDLSDLASQTYYLSDEALASALFLEINGEDYR